METCSICSRVYKKVRSAGHRGTICNSCQVTKRRRAIKQRIVELKGGCCQICGYKKCLRALEFHHLDPSQKEIKIANATLYPWTKIQKELDKCILLCTRCHVEVHEGIVSVPV